MANTILAVDNLDNDLGHFFDFCRQNLEDFFVNFNIVPKLLNGHNLNDLSVQLTTAPLGKFVFAAYSHGDKEMLIKANAPYVSTVVNNNCFNNSFFYTFSCNSGHVLGSTLVQNGCLCYIGYNRVIAIWSTYIGPFMECANHGLIQFYSGHKTSSVLVKMNEKYNSEIDNVYKMDFFIASILRENRDALVMWGNDIDINDVS